MTEFQKQVRKTRYKVDKPSPPVIDDVAGFEADGVLEDEDIRVGNGKEIGLRVWPE